MKFLKFFFCLLLAGSLLLCLIFGETIPNLASRRYSVRGADVSHYQGTIDWQTFSRELDFVFIKATEGSSHVDPCLNINRQPAEQTDLAVGYYHFFSFETPGAAQAAHFIETVGPLDGCLPPAADVEFYGGRQPEKEDLLRELSDFLQKLEEVYHVKPIVYTTASFYRAYLKEELTEYPLWIRDVCLVPHTDWTFWQYSDLGQFSFYDGEEKHLDLNVFSGTKKDLQQFLLPK